jgi:hypothetical protein
MTTNHPVILADTKPLLAENDRGPIQVANSGDRILNDAASRVSTITYPDTLVVTYTRDAMGRITAVSDKPAGAGSPTTLASSIAYKPFGPWTGFTDAQYLIEQVNRVCTVESHPLRIPFDEGAWLVLNVELDSRNHPRSSHN